jgi:hypothetical protein
MAPKEEGKSIVNSAEDGDKMVFERHSLFGDVATVTVQGDLLVSHSVLCNAFFEFC